MGVSNVWAQSGMKARDAALLGGLLAIYDFVFTAQLPVMDDLLTRLAALPFAPQVVWPTGDGQWVGIGLGDLLLATAFPLVMRKAFGQSAGLAASAIVNHGRRHPAGARRPGYPRGSLPDDGGARAMHATSVRPVDAPTGRRSGQPGTISRPNRFHTSAEAGQSS